MSKPVIQNDGDHKFYNLSWETINTVKMSPVNREREERKTTFSMSSDLLRKLAMRAAEMGKPQKWIVARSVGAFLFSNVRADDYVRKLLFGFHISADPEDRVEVEMSVETLKTLHAEVHTALRELGENPSDCKA